MKNLELKTRERCVLVDVTPQLQQVLQREGWIEGALLVHCPHTTAGLTVNEGADPDVRLDLIRRLEALAPMDSADRHAEGNSDAHLKASLLGCSVILPVTGGRLALGTWQAVYFGEFDGPRTRRLTLTFLRG